MSLSKKPKVSPIKVKNQNAYKQDTVADIDEDEIPF